MTSRPVTITSPTHALGISAVVTQATLALMLLLGYGTTDAVGTMLSLDVADVLLPLLMFTASVGALGSIVAVASAQCRNSATLLPAMRIELACKIALTFTTLTYTLALIQHYNFTEAPNITTYTLIAGLGFAARSWQIRRDMRRVKVALEAGVAANPAPLGDPTARS